MKLTRKGQLTLAVAAVLGVGGLVLRAPAATAIAVFLLAGMAVAVNSVRDVRVEATRTRSRKRFGEQEPLRITLDLENPGNRTQHVEIREDLPRQARILEGTNRGHVALSAGEHVEIELKVGFAVRGSYTLGPLTARLTDAFGLVYDERELVGQDHVLVEPRVEKLKTIPIRSRLARTNLGSHITRRSGEGFEFYAIRPYAPGDTPRMINWKASARTDEMLVNQRSHESYAEVTIFVDVRARSEVGVERFTPLAQGARAVASVATYLRKQRDVLRVHMYGTRTQTLQPKTAGNYLRDLLETLALAQPAGRMSLADALDDVLASVLPRSPVVVVSSLEADPTASTAVRRLLAGDHQVTIISPRPALEGTGDPVTNRLLRRQRARTIRQLRGQGAAVLDWEPGAPLNTSIMEALR